VSLGRIDWSRLRQLMRFYQAAIINTTFGLSTYFLLVWLGLNLYAAQAISHVMGMTFNYFTYSRHVFRGASPAKIRFALSYIIYYFVNLASLFIISRFILSPYVAGFLAAFSTSLLNYFILKRFVFGNFGQ
jgi:putative flippase GtrA